MQTLDYWESLWAPYDEATYRAVLRYIQPNDVVLDIGAGDLRLTRQIARIALQVFAIEIQPELLASHNALPRNMTVICADTRTIHWPYGITLGVLLMRHCTHFREYVTRLRAAGCQWLVTNARWRMDVELMNLGPRQAWNSVEMGWYACTCGRTGFVPGPVEQLTPGVMEQIAEVETCPACT
jgi:hypothetical protein